jgi:hypothetical protein
VGLARWSRICEVTANEITMLPSALFRAFYGWMFPHHCDMRPQMAETLAARKASLED